MTTLTLTLPTDLVERLDRYGERLGASNDRAMLAETAIRTFLAEHDDLDGADDRVSAGADAKAGESSRDEVALRSFMVEHGYADVSASFCVTPAEQGSGLSDVSVNHDRYLTE